MSSVQPERMVRRRLARMGVAVAVVASSGTVGFVASKVWPLPGSAGGERDASLLSATVSGGGQADKKAAVARVPKAAAASDLSPAPTPAGLTAAAASPTPVPGTTPTEEKKAAAPAAEDQSEEAETAAGQRRAAREARRQRKARRAQNATRHRPRPATYAQSSPSAGNLQHDYALRDFMTGSAPKY